MMKVLGKEVARAGGYNSMNHMENVLAPPHLLRNIEITKYFNYEPRPNDVYVKNDLPRIRDGVYVINLDSKQSKGTHWML